jgi:hypothetical protein
MNTENIPQHALCPACDSLLSVDPMNYPFSRCKCGFIGTPNYITEPEARKVLEGQSGIPQQPLTRDGIRAVVRQEIANALVSMAASLRRQG